MQLAQHLHFITWPGATSVSLLNKMGHMHLLSLRVKMYANHLDTQKPQSNFPTDYFLSNQSIVKEINSEYSLECSLEINPDSFGNKPTLILKLKLQCSGHLMQRADSLEIRSWCWERLRAEVKWCDREWDAWMASPTQWIWVSANSRRW